MLIEGDFVGQAEIAVALPVVVEIFTCTYGRWIIEMLGEPRRHHIVDIIGSCKYRFIVDRRGNNNWYIFD